MTYTGQYMRHCMEPAPGIVPEARFCFFSLSCSVVGCRPTNVVKADAPILMRFRNLSGYAETRVIAVHHGPSFLRESAHSLDRFTSGRRFMAATKDTDARGRSDSARHIRSCAMWPHC